MKHRAVQTTIALAIEALFILGAWAADGVVAVQTAAPSCGDDSNNTYVPCGNGTITDNRTGLVWLRDADCLGTEDWLSAMAFAAGLSDLPGTSMAASDDCGLSDGSSPGDWRLPSLAEWEAMIADADGGPGELNCNPAITNNEGTSCWLANPLHCVVAGGTCSFKNVQQSFYWSSTTSTDTNNMAWQVLTFDDSAEHATLGKSAKTSSLRVWPVRDGQ